MEDKADVGLVDSHAEGDGGHHHDTRLGHEFVLVRIARRLFHARVIGQGRDSMVDQKSSRLFGLLARQAVDDPAFATIPFYDREHLGPPGALQFDRQLDVGSIETKDDDLRIVVKQLRRDVPAGDLVGGRRERRDGDVGEDLPQAGEVTVFRAE